MKKFFFAVVALLSLLFLWAQTNTVNAPIKLQSERKLIHKFALVSDSENDNGNLKTALDSAKANGAQFVIGLGDFTPLGELEDLRRAKATFEAAGISYFVTAGDRDLWASRNADINTYAYFNQTFGETSHTIDKEGMQIVILDNSNIYKGLTSENLKLVETIKNSSSEDNKVRFVMAHKTPYHPQSAHIMGADNADVANQAKDLLNALEAGEIDGFFSGDLHFFARYNSPKGVKITTIGALNRERTFQGPRFAIVSVFDDQSWEVEDIEVN